MGNKGEVKNRKHKNNENSKKEKEETKVSKKAKGKSDSDKRTLYRRIFTRVSLIVVAMVVVYLTTQSAKDDFSTNSTVFVNQQEKVNARMIEVDCSKEYKNEVQMFPSCAPAKCRRVVFDYLVTEEESEKLLEIGKKGLELGGSDGGASVLDLHSGALSHGKQFVNVYTVNGGDNLFTASDFKFYTSVRKKIQLAIARQFSISPDAIYLTHPTFFSRLTEKPPVTPHDEYWHPHVDKETYQSFHYTSLLYLNDFGVDYKGGRFVFIETDRNSTTIVEPRKGRVSAFTSGWENLHYVEKVTSGTRYALTVSFTCDPKYAIKDPSY